MQSQLLIAVSIMATALVVPTALSAPPAADFDADGFNDLAIGVPYESLGKDPLLLAPLHVILADLNGLEIEHQAALVRNVSEGPFHSGDASVVQVLARKR